MVKLRPTSADDDHVKIRAEPTAIRHGHGGDRVAIGLTLVLAVMIVLVVLAFRSTSAIEHSVEDLASTEHELFDLAWEIRFLDEELTLAASRYIDADATERALWRNLYDNSATELDEAIGMTRSLLSTDQLVHLNEVSDANDQLIALEMRIFAESDLGNNGAAREILTGDYTTFKEIYRHGIDNHFTAQESMINTRTDAIVTQTGLAKIVASAVLVIIALLIGYIARINRQQKARARERETERTAYMARQIRQAQIRDGFEMSLTEVDALATFESAVRQELPNWHTELLLADSSSAHLQRLASTHGDGREPNCGVATPTDCPAIRRGSVLTFDDSDRYSSCPSLRGRDLQGGTAVCVPLKIMGKSIGISHSIAPACEGDQLERITEIVQGGGDRLGVLRAFATTRRQAARDPLTGLHNRRSLEEIAHELDSKREAYSLAFCDLDQFKSLNDTHGHGTGDRALRRFTQILTSTLRPVDIAARWGGEEFIVVFPDTNAAAAAIALDRLREALALALLDGNIPRFTFSAGVTETEGDFATATSIADAALLEAKRLGRDRVIIAGAESALPSETPGSGDSNVAAIG